MGETAKQFIEKYLNLLTIAFVVLLVLGFWLIGHKARKTGQMADQEAGGESRAQKI